MGLKTVAKAVLAAIGFLVAFALNALPVGDPWRALLVAVVGVVTTYTIWRVPNSGFVRVPVERDTPSTLSEQL